MVWTGTEMIVWAGWQDCSSGTCEDVTPGGRYNPATDTWIATEPLMRAWNLREHRLHSAVWTGSEMVVWGGAADYGLDFGGGRYMP